MHGAVVAERASARADGAGVVTRAVVAQIREGGEWLADIAIPNTDPQVWAAVTAPTLEALIEKLTAPPSSIPRDQIRRLGGGSLDE